MMETPDTNTEISPWPGLHRTAIERENIIHGEEGFS